MKSFKKLIIHKNLFRGCVKSLKSSVVRRLRSALRFIYQSNTPDVICNYAATKHFLHSLKGGLTLFVFLLLSMSINLHAQTVRVAAAGNLRYILDDIKAQYAIRNPKVAIDVTLGASGSLTQQIINGAGFDFFMAADKAFPDKLKEQGAASGDVKTYAFGKLVLWSSALDVTKGIDILSDKSVTKIAIAKPAVAPYGERAVQCLKYYGLFEKVKDKIVYADNIAQAAQYASTGNAEVGFLAYALVLGPEMKDKGKYFVLDTKSYKPVEQACVLIKGWERNPEAARFMKFVLSAECKPIFEKYGFIVP